MMTGLIGERVHLVIMFVDICGSSLLASQLEPETYSDILENLRQKIESVSLTCFGQIIRIDGDGCILTFEHHMAHERASQNAIQSAVDIHKYVDDILSNTLPSDQKIILRTAIHSGIVFVKKGNLKTGVIEILGEPTNTTSHLCNVLSPGDIAVTRETLNPHNCSFKNIVSKSKFIPKLEKTIHYKLINKSNKTKNSIENLTKFVGRKNILVHMRRFIKSADMSKRLLMITAEAGLGKSRLLSEFICQNKSSKMILLKGRCELHLGVKAFQPIEQIIYAKQLMLASLDNPYQEGEPDRYEQILQIITGILEQVDSSLGRSNDIVEKIKGLIVNLCNLMPSKTICFIIDDWQWIDDSSSLLIDQLIKNGPKNLKFIFASRVENQVFSEMNNVKVLSLQPLTNVEIKQVATSLVPGIEPFSIMRVQNHSGGNPLYLEELCHAIRDSRFNVQTHTAESWLESLIFTRFSQLSDDLKSIVKVAAVIGFLVPKWLLELILNEMLTDKQFDALAQADFLYPSDRYDHVRFKHGITKSVVYKMISLKQRHDIHKRIIDHLIKRSDHKFDNLQNDQLAYHYKQSGEHEKSIHHSKIAGEIALKKSTLDKAQAHYKNALILSQNCPISDSDRLEILNNYGRSCIVDPAHEHLSVLMDTLTYARENLNDDLMLWSEYWVGFLLYGLGYPQKSVEHFEACKKLAILLNHTGLIVQLKANLGQAYAAACQYNKAYIYLDDAIKLKQERNTTQRPSASLAYAISCKGFALGEQGYIAKAEACFAAAEQALKGEEHVAHTSILNQKAVVHLWHDNIDACLDLTASSEEMSKRMRSRYNYAQSIFLSSAAKFRASHDGTHLQRMIQSTNWLVYDGVGQNLSLNYGAISEALALTQNWPKLRIYAARGLKRARLGDKRCESQILHALAMAAKGGETFHSYDVYMKRAKISAEERGSIRELKNNKKLQDLFV